MELKIAERSKINSSPIIKISGTNFLSSGFERIPQMLKQLTEAQVADVEKLLEKIEEDDDVQNVYHTMEEN